MLTMEHRHLCLDLERRPMHLGTVLQLNVILGMLSKAVSMEMLRFAAIMMANGILPYQFANQVSINGGEL